jgi:bacterioferritin
MKAKEGVIELLNRVLTNELTAINQYFVHAEMCHHWGFERLYEKIRKHSFDEMKDAHELIEHILYLDGIPNLQRLGQVQIGETVLEQLNLDLRLEQDAVGLLTEGIVHCVRVNDFNTRAKLERMVHGEEGHIDWIETQLDAIKQVGIENYLSQQLTKE